MLTVLWCDYPVHDKLPVSDFSPDLISEKILGFESDRGRKRERGE